LPPREPHREYRHDARHADRDHAAAIGTGPPRIGRVERVLAHSRVGEVAGRGELRGARRIAPLERSREILREEKLARLGEARRGRRGREPVSENARVSAGRRKRERPVVEPELQLRLRSADVERLREAQGAHRIAEEDDREPVFRIQDYAIDARQGRQRLAHAPLEFLLERRLLRHRARIELRDPQERDVRVDGIGAVRHG